MQTHLQLFKVDTMAVEIKMPQLSDTMDAGKILTWNKQEGEKISRGDILAEVETDKANLEIESFNEGFLLKIVVPEGESASVGEPIAFIGEQGESVDSGNNNGSTAPTNHTEAAGSSPSVTETAEESEQPEESEQHSANEPIKKNEPAPETGSHENYSQSNTIKASPLARKLADQHNVNLGSIQGSGPNGRIIKKDVEAAAGADESAKITRATQSAREVSSRAEAAPPVATSEGTRTPLSKMRATIAKRMQQAVTEAPHFYTTISIDMTESIKLRGVFKDSSEFKEISINHLIIKAAAYALKRESGVNASLKGEDLFQPDDINIGVVTAVEGGLMIPVIRSVDMLHLKDLAFETRAAIDRARAGRPNGTDLSGGTFSISNMGMFGVESFTAIINPGQGAILAVGATIEKPVVKNGVVQSAPIMQVTLSVDHRIIDGTMSGTWLSHFKQALEQPAIILI